MQRGTGFSLGVPPVFFGFCRAGGGLPGLGCRVAGLPTGGCRLRASVVLVAEQALEDFVGVVEARAQGAFGDVEQG